MAFCTRCGHDVTAQSFCVQCGKMVQTETAPPPASGAEPAAPPPPPPVYQVYSPPEPIHTRKTSAVVWIVAGVLGFFVLMGLLGAAALGLFLHHVKQNPALAMGKLLAAANPNVEVVSSDSGNNTVTFRDKRSGETVTMNFDDIKRGRIDFHNSQGQHATIDSHGVNGNLEFTTPDGSVKFGAGAASARMPDWVPQYPGSSPLGNFSLQAQNGSSGSFHFTTTDAAPEVLSFYEQAFRKAGLSITGNVAGMAAGRKGGMVSARDPDGRRNCMVIVGMDGSSTAVNLVVTSKP